MRLSCALSCAVYLWSGLISDRPSPYQPVWEKEGAAAAAIRKARSICLVDIRVALHQLSQKSFAGRVQYQQQPLTPLVVFGDPVAGAAASTYRISSARDMLGLGGRTGNIICAMSAPAALARTAPIAIAPKSPRLPRRQGSVYSGGLSIGGLLESPGSDSPLNGRSPTPCEACQRRRVRCVMAEDDDSCVPCQAEGAECSLLESPQPRKRKLNGDLDEGHSKRR